MSLTQKEPIGANKLTPSNERYLRITRDQRQLIPTVRIVSVSERGACRSNGKTDENVVNVVAMTNQESVVRAINLVEVLTEDLED